MGYTHSKKLQYAATSQVNNVSNETGSVKKNSEMKTNWLDGTDKLGRILRGVVGCRRYKKFRKLYAPACRL